MPAIMSAGFNEADPANHEEALVFRTLGKTGLKVPVISMGTGDTSNPKLVRAAWDNHIILFGTSTYYGNGNNETMLGSVIKDLPRESCLIATSTMPRGTDEQNGIFTDPDAAPLFKKEIEGSMKRLGLNYLDILFLPWVAKRESVFFEPLLRMMEDFKSQGKARYIGIATHSFVDEALRAAADTHIYDLAMTAYNFRFEHLPAVNEAIDYAAGAGLGIIAMKTQAGGFWDEKRSQPINAQAALKWVLKNKNVHTVMAGMTTYDELMGNLTMVKDLNLNQDELKELKQADLDNNCGMYCLQCRKCMDLCPEQLDIPTLMRSYMYAYGYRNLAHARQTLDYANIPANPCGKCDVCPISCTAGFNIRNKVRQVARLIHVPQDFPVS
jgi:predicted aldo/keto reductase-like oxidoreductase